MHEPGTRSIAAGAAIAALTAAALAACSAGGGGTSSSGSASAGGQQARPAAASKTQQIVAAPKGLLAAGQPQTNGTLWTLAGDAAAKGLYDISLTGAGSLGSIRVSSAAQSVTESLDGIVGLALGKGSAGAVELINGSTGTVSRTVALGAPARDVIVGSDGATFYVLDGTRKSASVTVVDSRDGGVQGTFAVPLGTVSIAPDAEDSSVYALQADGQVDQVAVAGGGMLSSFSVGPVARSLALSPDGSDLYVLRDVGRGVANVAEVNLATESVQRVLPAPANCLQVLVSADGNELYQLVGTPKYGNIQVYPS